VTPSVRSSSLRRPLDLLPFPPRSRSSPASPRAIITQPPLQTRSPPSHPILYPTSSVAAAGMSPSRVKNGKEEGRSPLRTQSLLRSTLLGERSSLLAGSGETKPPFPIIYSCSLQLYLSTPTHLPFIQALYRTKALSGSRSHSLSSIENNPTYPRPLFFRSSFPLLPPSLFSTLLE